MNNLSIGGILFLIALILGLLFLAPWFTMWSLNVVFGLGLTMSAKMYFSLLWLAMVVGGSKISRGD